MSQGFQILNSAEELVVDSTRHLWRVVSSGSVYVPNFGSVWVPVTGLRNTPDWIIIAPQTVLGTYANSTNVGAPEPDIWADYNVHQFLKGTDGFTAQNPWVENTFRYIVLAKGHVL